jgi:hypothetical protein
MNAVLGTAKSGTPHVLFTLYMMLFFSFLIVQPHFKFHIIRTVCSFVEAHWQNASLNGKLSLSCHFLWGHLTMWAAGWRSWLRHCTTSQKVAGSIPTGAVGLITSLILLATQEYLLWGALKWSVCKADNLATFMC